MRVIGSGEFPPGALEPLEIPTEGISRRRFLTLVSASAALAAGAACSKIDRGALVPYTRKPEEIVPGVATYYASTFAAGLTAQSVLVKTREGRPIHVEGNPEDPDSGAASLHAIADVLGLYDPDRLRAPRRDGQPVGWDEAIALLARTLRSAEEHGNPTLLLTGAHLSPSRRALIAELKRALPRLRHVAWEPSVGGGELNGLRAAFGEAVRPRLHLDRAQVTVAFEADLLGGANEPRLVREFAASRVSAGTGVPASRLWALEGTMTLTGANADERISLKPSRAAALALALARALHQQGLALPAGLDPAWLAPFGLDSLAGQLAVAEDRLAALVADLRGARSAAVVVAGPALPPEAHVACALLNAMLGAEGSTLDTTATSPLEVATHRELSDVLQEAAGGRFAAAVFWDVNPGHSFGDHGLWRQAMARIPFRVRMSLHEDETARDCQLALPVHHWLEAWGDHEPALDRLILQQPAIGPLHDTRQAEEILLGVLGRLGVKAAPSYRDYVKARWQREVYPAGSPVPFERFWNAALHDGVFRREPGRPAPRALRVEAVKRAAQDARRQSEGFELVLTPGLLHDGRYANNGWLQELPHPVSKTTWGNPLTIAPADARRLHLENGDVVKLAAGSGAVEAPVLVLPGQAPGVLGLELGQGRTTGSVAVGVGENAFVLVDGAGPAPWLRTGVQLQATGARRVIPRTQEYQRMEDRDIARSLTPAELAAQGAEAGKLASLYPEQKFPEHKWGMAIDLSACVGCGACVVACQSENNIPVVGPEQVARGRVMHWIRIDRYEIGEAEQPRVVHQPMLCQQCDNAPCEAVCPVNATTHSPDGLNQMAYNRCVGTRYCANNCPYKVRRFNFLDFTSAKVDPERLVFNPEVTVRPRGVMEKCTFCVQRIEDGRMRAKAEDREVRDGEIRPACAVACPAEAIVFGDLNDPQSRVAQFARGARGYKVLAELGVRPAVTYLADVRNPVEKGRRS